MRIVKMVPFCKALIFDMDGTLYTNREYGQFQEDSQVRRLAQHLNISYEEAASRLEISRKTRKTSMGQHFLSFGISMKDIVRWREEEIEPAQWLSPDPALESAVSSLSKRFRLAVLTNNPRLVGYKTLEVLGVRHCFEVVVGLDDTGCSKPALEPFLKILDTLGLAPVECVSIGDRFDIDIEPALALGMSAILVDGAEDIYTLPKFLNSDAIA